MFQVFYNVFQYFRRFFFVIVDETMVRHWMTPDLSEQQKTRWKTGDRQQLLAAHKLDVTFQHVFLFCFFYVRLAGVHACMTDWIVSCFQFNSFSETFLVFAALDLVSLLRDDMTMRCWWCWANLTESASGNFSPAKAREPDSLSSVQLVIAAGRVKFNRTFFENFCTL